MNITLKQAAQQALDAFDAFGEDDNFESLFALSQKMEALRTVIQQAEVTNEREAFESCALMEGSLFKRRADDPDKYWDGNVQDDWELWKARAILNLHPEKVPMTDDERGEAFLKYSRSSEGYRSTFMRGVWAAEIYHGIKSKE